MACIYPKRGSVRLRVFWCDLRLPPPEREDGQLRTMGVAAPARRRLFTESGDP